MKFARFKKEYGEEVAVNPSLVHAIYEGHNEGTIYIENEISTITVQGSFDEVVAELERCMSATGWHI